MEKKESRKEEKYCKNSTKKIFFGNFPKIQTFDQVEIIGLDHKDPFQIIDRFGVFVILKLTGSNGFLTKYWLVDTRDWEIINSKEPGHAWRDCLVDLSTEAKKRHAALNQMSLLSVVEDQGKDRPQSQEEAISRVRHSIWLREDLLRKVREVAREEGHGKIYRVVEKALECWINDEK